MWSNTKVFILNNLETSQYKIHKCEGSCKWWAKCQLMILSSRYENKLISKRKLWSTDTSAQLASLTNHNTHGTLPISVACVWFLSLWWWSYTLPLASVAAFHLHRWADKSSIHNTLTRFTHLTAPWWTYHHGAHDSGKYKQDCNL